ncbi:MAG: dipeptidase [Rhodobacteraceae bacterium]|nr:dipeptidase [Paracoccaceae bacterium]
MKRFVHPAALLIAAGLTACAAAPANKPSAPDAAAIHQHVITFDAEMDIPFDFMAGDKDAGRETPMQIDLPKMDRGGLDGAAFVVFVPQDKRTPDLYAKARESAQVKLAALEKMFAAYPERIGLARSADEAEALVKAGKHFAMISVVNAYPCGEDISCLADWYARGLRMVAFTHAGHNQFSDSNRPQERFGDGEAEHGGLSALGKQAIAEMNRLGIIVDVSQITTDAVMQAVSLSKTPVVASHVGVRTIVDTSRNLTDAEMKAIAGKDGVVGIVAFNSYLKAPSAEQNADLASIEKKYGLKTFTEARSKLMPDQFPKFLTDMDAYRARWPGATVADMVDSIDYAVKLIGIDHVGISTDMEHSGGVVGYKTAAEAGNLTAELVKRGYSEADIGKLWSGNFFRVWRAAEAAAKK